MCSLDEELIGKIVLELQGDLVLSLRQVGQEITDEVNPVLEMLREYVNAVCSGYGRHSAIDRGERGFTAAVYNSGMGDDGVLEARVFFDGVRNKVESAMVVFANVPKSYDKKFVN